MIAIFQIIPLYPNFLHKKSFKIRRDLPCFHRFLVDFVNFFLPPNNRLFSKFSPFFVTVFFTKKGVFSPDFFQSFDFLQLKHNYISKIGLSNFSSWSGSEILIKDRKNEAIHFASMVFEHQKSVFWSETRRFSCQMRDYFWSNQKINPGKKISDKLEDYFYPGLKYAHFLIKVPRLKNIPPVSKLYSVQRRCSCWKLVLILLRRSKKQIR